MAINKKLIHFNTFENFNSKKLSANIENTKYTLGIDGEIQTGSPDILYQSIVYIKDTKQQWTHGQLYTSDDNYFETKEDALSKLQEAKSYTDNKTDELRDIVTQTLSLTSGTIWCSFYVDITLEQLQQALGTNATTITTSFDGTTEVTSSYDVSTNTWSGDLTTLDVTKMYMIAVNTDCEISLTGRKIPNSTSYTLNPGWNWIGYPVRDTVYVKDALANLVPSNGDVIKSKDWSMTYLMGQWLGVKEMTPGMGYMYKSNAGSVKNLIYTIKSIDVKSELSKKQNTLVSGINIKTVNGESLLGEGDIVISGGNSSSGGTYSLVEHDINDTTCTLTPNTFHVWGEVNNLTLTFGEEQSGVANEFLFQFESGETATTLTLPYNLIWANDDTPVIESNYTYQVSILKGFATLMKFKKAVLQEFTITIYDMFSWNNYREEIYSYKVGMTWGQWVNSEYNTTGNYKIDDNGNIYKDDSNLITGSGETDIKYSSGSEYDYVNKSQFIDNNIGYWIE